MLVAWCNEVSPASTWYVCCASPPYLRFRRSSGIRRSAEVRVRPGLFVVVALTTAVKGLDPSGRAVALRRLGCPPVRQCGAGAGRIRRPEGGRLRSLSEATRRQPVSGQPGHGPLPRLGARSGCASGYSVPRMRPLPKPSSPSGPPWPAASRRSCPGPRPAHRRSRPSPPHPRQAPEREVRLSSALVVKTPGVDPLEGRCFGVPGCAVMFASAHTVGPSGPRIVPDSTKTTSLPEPPNATPDTTQFATGWWMCTA
ncbi:hypothetical protein QFZ66_005191 [Streptomyces sp. B4I13]|nr:hypothetical protein [Streptomyces sp. B4I13]